MNNEVRLTLSEMRLISGKKYCHAIAAWFFRKKESVLVDVYSVHVKAHGEVDDAGLPYVFKRVQ